MRTIERDIAGAFIFSADGKVLLGNNKKGGTYQGMLVVPGGGIEAGETPLDAAKREILEETGIDVSNASITPLEYTTTGESEKTLKGTNETVLVKMKFHDFQIKLNEKSKDIVLKFDDDFGNGQWYTPRELESATIGPNTMLTLKNLHFL